MNATTYPKGKEKHVTYFLHSAMDFLYASTTKTAQN